jgi:peptidoglycan-N-acetylglucosamine deacetylase
VFYDPTGKRWVRFRRSLQTGALFGSIAVILLTLVILLSPQLPALGLPRVEHLAGFAEVRGIIAGERSAKNVPYIRARKALKDVKYVRSSSPVLHPKTAARMGDDKPVVFGFFVNWDPAALVSLRFHLGHLTHLVPEWFTLANSKGDMNDESDPTVIQIAQQGKLPIIALLTNFRQGWQGRDVHQLLNNAAARANLIDNIHANLVEHKFAGINIDFEQVARRDRDALVRFMRELSAQLKPHGLLLTQSVPVDDPAYDLKRLAEINDYLIPMVYDEHYQSGTPGPVASEEWFEAQLETLKKAIPPAKTVIGIGNYGYDWIIGERGSAEVSFDDVMSAAVARDARVEWDDDAVNPVLRYDAAGRRHEVWFLDAVTGLNHVVDASDAGFRGVAVWRLGAEDPGLWTVLKPEAWPEDDFDPAQLATLLSQKSVKHYGEGEVIRIVETPRDGQREVKRASDGNYNAKYGQLPSYYVMEHTGSRQDKALVLSFDDGPDAEWTPKILDVLKSRGVLATFFVVGVNAESAPDVVRRMYAEGHEIGNHSYSHPNIALTSPERTKLELSATLRIIENLTGVATMLFRPPYNADSLPQTPEELAPVLRAQQAGYITIGERIDPRDWEKGVTADKILEDIDAEAGEGNIVLLHDGGGDRSATLAALPRIIDKYRGLGYRFLTIGQLIGRSRDQMMPKPSAEELRLARIEGGALDIKSALLRLVGFLFLGAIYLTLLRSLVYGVLAVIQKRRARRRVFAPDFRPSVSVVVAAYNEEKVIAGTVEAVLDNDYEDLEVIVVDDGSKDRTLEVLRQRFGGDARVTILTQLNAGKSAALNHAIAHAANAIVVALDADTIFRRGTIAKLVRHFHDPRIGAVSGNARVGNRNRWITRFQAIEYIYGFNLDRRALDLLNAITVVPGAVGAWRKDLIVQLGGFSHDTLAEDTDLTLAIRRLGYVIRYEEEALAYTEAPEDTRSLARQRFRWAFGTLQAAWKHRDALFLPEYGSLGFVALPSIWLFQIVLSALSPFAEAAMVVAVLGGNWRVVLLYYLGFFVLELLTGLLAYGLEGERPGDLWLLFFQRIYYRELMYYVLARSVLHAIRGRIVGWGKLERRATVTGAP